jgi:hypothetical protein
MIPYEMHLCASEHGLGRRKLLRYQLIDFIGTAAPARTGDPQILNLRTHCPLFSANFTDH